MMLSDAQKNIVVLQPTLSADWGCSENSRTMLFSRFMSDLIATLINGKLLNRASEPE